MSTEYLVRLAETYAEDRALSISTVSTYSANDGKWIGNLKAGASCTVRKAAVVMRWFADNWPADLEWPRDIPRPTKSKKEAA